MNFADLLSLAKKNDSRAQVEIKSSKGPVTEYTTPGRDVKVKPDLKSIQARLQEHQKRLQKPSDKPNPTVTGAQHGGVTRKPPNVSGKSLSAVNIAKTAATNGQKMPSTQPALQSRQTIRPVPSKSSAPPNSAGLKPSSTIKDRRASTTSGLQSSAKPSNLKYVKPGPTPTPNGNPHSGPFARGQQPRPASSLTKVKPAAPPPPSFSSLLRMAKVQQDNPDKSSLPAQPGPSKEKAAFSLPVSRHDEGRPNGRSRDAPASSSQANKTGQVGQRVPANAKSSDQSVSSSSGVNLMAVRNQPKKAAHLISDKRPIVVSGGIGSDSPSERPRFPSSIQRSSLPSEQFKSGFAAPMNKNTQSISSLKPLPLPAYRGVVHPIKTTATQRPPVAAQAKNLSAFLNKKAPLSKIPGITSSSRAPVPPVTQPPARNRVYPNGPSFPAFRPLPRKRIQTSRYQDEDSEYDEEMDDFIVDNDEEEEGNPSHISDQIREIFGYDRRRFVGREPDNDDDLRHMESGVHTMWREEERSEQIGRLEDEIAEEEELEEERKALIKKRDLLRKNKRLKQ